MTTQAQDPGIARDVTASPANRLPGWRSVLAVVAHPDDESFGLGAVLDAFARTGAEVSVLCLTQGEASTLALPSQDGLARLRAAELQEAARTLGAARTVLRDHRDGALAAAVPAAVDDVLTMVAESMPDGLLVFDADGVSGHPDHVAATAAALQAADRLGLPVLAWTLPRSVAEVLNDEYDTSFSGALAAEIDLVVEVTRDRQRLASLAHASQAVPTSVLWRRLELLADREHLRWLRPPLVAAARPGPPAVAAAATGTVASPAIPAAADPGAVPSVRVDYRHGDQFGIAIRGHVLTVDQPTDAGGEDLGPTPTELFVAGLVSCVAFYARRYLRRHKYDATGLTVSAEYTMAAKPARVGAVRIRIDVPTPLPATRRDGLLATAGHCTVHNSITIAPELSIVLT